MNERIKLQVIAISRMSETEWLYKLETKRNEAIRKCAEEWLSFLKKRDRVPQDEKIWTRAVPQAMLDTLMGFEQKSEELAATAYLEHRGYTVSAPSGAKVEV